MIVYAQHHNYELDFCRRPRYTAIVPRAMWAAIHFFPLTRGARWLRFRARWRGCYLARRDKPGPWADFPRANGTPEPRADFRR